MATYPDSNPYNDNDTTNVFEVPSTIEYPDMTQADPLGHFEGVPDASFGGYGTGGETLNPDGSVSTRYKSQSGNQRGGGVDGGSP